MGGKRARFRIASRRPTKFRECVQNSQTSCDWMQEHTSCQSHCATACFSSMRGCPEKRPRVTPPSHPRRRPTMRSGRARRNPTCSSEPRQALPAPTNRSACSHPRTEGPQRFSRILHCQRLNPHCHDFLGSGRCEAGSPTVRDFFGHSADGCKTALLCPLTRPPPTSWES